VTHAYRERLGSYLAGRRWFAGKGREFSVTHVHALPWLATDPRVRIEILTVEYADGKRDHYQFPVAYLDELDDGASHALVGEFEHPELGDVVAYDAVHLRQANALLLEGFRSPPAGDEIAFEVVEGADLPDTDAVGMTMTAEHSNTSIAYGEQGILKLFRRVSPGSNPDIEIHHALTRAGAEHIAPLLGWISGSWDDPDGSTHSGDLAMLQAFLRTATDGWTIALSSVRDLLVEEDLHPGEVGADFAGEAERLGEATADIHANLAEIFGTQTLSGDELRSLARAMALRLESAIGVVPELAKHESGLRAHYDALADHGGSIPVQRVHGDFHLGQTLRTVKGWKIIDFEGEPAKLLEERVRPDSRWRDVAGMLRSLDYAAGSTLREFGAADQLGYRAHEWALHNRKAFVAGYSSIAGPPSDSDQVLLRAYETDKAVYEAVYEARHRPTWLEIPLNAIASLASEE
jgi:maltokinase